VAATPNLRVALGDWGYLIALVGAAGIAIGAALIHAQQVATRMVIEHLRGLYNKTRAHPQPRTEK